MFQETEAQKVIAISLGKIAISRNQRGGPKLFKNLLVANVIQKARYAAWDETAQRYRARYEQRNNECETQQWEIVSKVQSNSTLNCSNPTENLSLNGSIGEDSMTNEFHRPNAASRDTEAAGTLVLSSSDAMEVTNNCASWDENNKENVLPNLENTTTDKLCNRDAFAGEKLYYSSAVSVPLRCVKRRSSTSEDNSSQQSTKKARRDYLKSSRQNWRRNEISANADSESDTEDAGLGLTPQSNEVAYRDIIDVSLVDDQMDLEQITSLVSVFSSSFKGLVDSPKTSSSGNGAELTGFYGDKTLRRGASGTPDVCSKQAGSVFTMRQSSFEATSVPIVALTV